MRFLADGNFDNRILEGVRLRSSDFDVIRVQDTDVYRADDPMVLAYAAREGRILLTRDANTMAGFAYDRIETGLPMPGVIEIRPHMPMGTIIDELLTIVGASEASEWENRVAFFAAVSPAHPVSRLQPARRRAAKLARPDGLKATSPPSPLPASREGEFRPHCLEV